MFYVCLCVLILIYAIEWHHIMKVGRHTFSTHQCLSRWISNFPVFCCHYTPHEFIITGDFNIHLYDHLDSFSQQFTDLLSSTNVTQHVSISTHIHNHTLDLVIISSHTNLALQQYHNLLSLYLITFIFSFTSTLHPHLPYPLLNLPSVAPKTLTSSNSRTTSLHPA